MDQNCLTTIGVILTAMGGLGGLLYRQILVNHAETMQIQADQIRDLQNRLDRALGVAEGQTEVNKDLVKTSRRR